MISYGRYFKFVSDEDYCDLIEAIKRQGHRKGWKASYELEKDSEYLKVIAFTPYPENFFYGVMKNLEKIKRERS